MERDKGSELLSKIGVEDHDDQAGAVHDRASDTAKCHLLDLPPELRNKIFALVVKQFNWIHLGLHYRGKVLPPLEPAFLRTCQQIRIECLPLFYGFNVFVIDCPCRKAQGHEIRVPRTMAKNMDKVKSLNINIRTGLYVNLNFRGGIGCCKLETYEHAENSTAYRSVTTLAPIAEPTMDPASRGSTWATKVLRQACDRGELQLTEKTFHDLIGCFFSTWEWA